MTSANVQFHNPAALAKPSGFSHLSVVPPGTKLVYVSGQVPQDADGNVVGEGDIHAQATQVFENLKAALAAAGASFGDVVKLNTYLTRADDVAAVREVRSRYLAAEHPPASTLIVVAALARRQFLLEIEAIAAVRA